MNEIPSDSRRGLYLAWADGSLPPLADPRLFARVFRATLTVLPEVDHRQVAGLWRKGRVGQGDRRARIPQIELTNQMPKNGIGECSAEGMRLRFMPYLLLLPIPGIMHTIAHEIAHVLRYATGEADTAFAEMKARHAVKAG